MEVLENFLNCFIEAIKISEEGSGANILQDCIKHHFPTRSIQAWLSITIFDLPKKVLILHVGGMEQDKIVLTTSALKPCSHWKKRVFILHLSLHLAPSWRGKSFPMPCSRQCLKLRKNMFRTSYIDQVHYECLTPNFVKQVIATLDRMIVGVCIVYFALEHHPSYDLWCLVICVMCKPRCISMV